MISNNNVLAHIIRFFLSFSLIPYREKSSSSDVVKRGPYSPFQVGTTNKVEYALARVDDLVNWGRRVNILVYYYFSRFMHPWLIQCG